MADETFFDGAFYTGSSFNYEVRDEVYTCEYHLPFYLVLATLGQEVAVGTWCVDLEMTPDEKRNSCLGPDFGGGTYFAAVQLDLVIIPGAGVWLVDTLWRDGRKELEYSKKSLEYVERALGRPHTSMPLRRAFMRVSDEPGPRLRGMPPTMVYGPDDYPRMAHELISRLPADHPYDEVDDFIRELLASGKWLDNKGPSSTYHCDWDIPTWLADRLPDVSPAARDAS